MPEGKENWFKLISNGILGRVGPGNVDMEVDRADQYKVAGPAAARSSILRQPNTVDTLALAEEVQKRGRK
jgi:hypothetical protein